MTERRAKPDAASRARARGGHPGAAAAKRWRPVFLRALEELGVVAYACKAADVSRATAYEARATDEIFRKSWDDALDVAADVLELEAHRRAVEGVVEPVTVAGEAVEVRRYSDRLLEFLLRARRPERFRDRYDLRHEVPGLTLARLIELAGEPEKT